MILRKLHKELLYAAIERWKGTPYKPGQQSPGPSGGVDCIRLVDAIYSETFRPGEVLDPLPREAQDAALHDRAVFVKIMRLAFDRFSLESIDTKRRLLPGDILCVRAKIKGETKNDKPKNPHHVIVVGDDGVLCWHAIPNLGVAAIGIGGVRACYDILAVWRTKCVPS